MTIDITIGKIKTLTFDEFIKQQLDEYNFTFKRTINVMDLLRIEQCPDEPDGCTSDDTSHPNEAYRSGSIFAISEFMREVLGDVLSDKLRPVHTNDPQITLLKPFINDINKIVYIGKEKMHHQRLHWLKFWCNRAIELYGNDAVIQFS